MAFAVPDTAHFPADVWRRILRNAAKRACLSATRPPIEGNARLRRLICAYLGAYRGVRCHEDRVLITTGGQQGLYLAGRVLREFTDAMFFEDPGYSGAQRAFEACRFRLHPVSVDEYGARFDTAVTSACPEAHAVYLTPSHQFPLGPTLSLERRMNALNWARERDGWIIEDDYDAEYRYDGEPLTALAGLDIAQRVIYVGTFSKALSPELRVGYVVVPDLLAARFRACKAFADGAGAMLLQTAIADFIQDGHFQAHLRRMRAVYRKKRDRLLQLLHLHDVPVGVRPRPAGMHVTLLLEQECSDVEVAQRMAERGFETLSLSEYYLEKGHARQGLLAGFTGASDVDLEDFVSALSAVLALRRSTSDILQ
jgi:GntR family transcriptional regulator/MocR family aminotransferase